MTATGPYIPGRPCDACGYPMHAAEIACSQCGPLDPIAAIDTPSLRRMAERAYRDAARSWSEYRAAQRETVRTHDHASILRALLDGAQSADAYYAHLRDTLALRED